MGDIEGVDGSGAELFVVAGPVIEGGQSEVVEDEIAVEGVGVEPQLIAEADPGHVRARRRGHTLRGASAGVPDRHKGRLAGGRERRRSHRWPLPGARTTNSPIRSNQWAGLRRAHF